MIPPAKRGEFVQQLSGAVSQLLLKIEAHPDEPEVTGADTIVGPDGNTYTVHLTRTQAAELKEAS